MIFAVLRTWPPRPPHLHVHELPLPPLLRAQPRVGAAGHPPGLALQLLPRRQPSLRQPTVGDGAEHGAPGLAVMATVAEPALPHERLDVTEGAVEPLLPHPQAGTADAGGVEQDSPTGHRHELARRRGVPALAVAADVRSSG